MPAQSFCDTLLAVFHDALKASGKAGSEPAQKEIWQAVMVTTRCRCLPYPAHLQRITARQVIPAHAVKYLLWVVTTQRSPAATWPSLRAAMLRRLVIVSQPSSSLQGSSLQRQRSVRPSAEYCAGCRITSAERNSHVGPIIL